MTETDQDINMVEVWLRKNPSRWIAGVLSGLFAGLVALVFAMVLSAVLGAEFLFPAKLPAVPFLGRVATEYGFHLVPILVGVLVHLTLCSVLGLVFSHFVFTNSVKALLAMGLVWGLFSWVFIYNLFVQSFTMVLALEPSPGPAFFVNVIFGLSLASLAFFSKITRRV